DRRPPPGGPPPHGARGLDPGAARPRRPRRRRPHVLVDGGVDPAGVRAAARAGRGRPPAGDDRPRHRAGGPDHGQAARQRPGPLPSGPPQPGPPADARRRRARRAGRLAGGRPGLLSPAGRPAPAPSRYPVVNVGPGAAPGRASRPEGRFSLSEDHTAPSSPMAGAPTTPARAGSSSSST